MAEAQPIVGPQVRARGLVIPWPVVALIAVVAAEVAFFGWQGAVGALPWGVAALLFAMAFACEFVDSSLGMGYGTTLTPLLMLLGFAPITIVPVVLLSEFITGLTAGGFHHSLGNADFRRGSRDRMVVTVLSLAGVAGAVVAVLVAVHLPPLAVKTYIGVMILAMGVLILAQRNRVWGFSLRKIAGLGLLSAFNKGISGGGYGPIVTAGQVLSGCKGKTAVGCTSVSEGLVCFVGVMVYAAMKGLPDMGLALPIVVGATISAPIAALTTKALDRRTRFEVLIGVLVCVLGVLTLWKVVVP